MADTGKILTSFVMTRMIWWMNCYLNLDELLFELGYFNLGLAIELS